MAESIFEPRKLVFRWITIHSHVFYSLMICYLIVLMECSLHSYKILRRGEVSSSEQSVSTATREKVFDLGIAIGSSILHGLSLVSIIVCSCLLEVRSFYQSTPPMLVTIVSTFNVFINVFGTILLMIQSNMHLLFSDESKPHSYMIRGAFYISTFALILSITSSILNIFFPSRHSVKYNGNTNQEAKTISTTKTRKNFEATTSPSEIPQDLPDGQKKTAGQLEEFMTY